MARHGLFKGGPRFEQPTRKQKHVLLPIKQKIMSIYFELGMYTEKQCNFTEQIDDNQPTILFRHYGAHMNQQQCQPFLILKVCLHAISCSFKGLLIIQKIFFDFFGYKHFGKINSGNIFYLIGGLNHEGVMMEHHYLLYDLFLLG